MSVFGWEVPGPDWSRWTPPGDVHDEPGEGRKMSQLLNADPGAFAALESQLSSTVLLAETTATGLVKARDAPYWYGSAADAYRDAVGDLPKVLYAAHDAYLGALQAVTEFADETYGHQSKLRTSLATAKELKHRYNAAVNASYDTAEEGRRAMTQVQGELTAEWATINRILAANDEAKQTFSAKMRAPARLAPRIKDSTPSVLHQLGSAALSPLKDIIETVGGTGGRIGKFASDPSWKNFGELAESLSLDAGLVALAASGGEGLAGLTLADASGDSTVAATSGVVSDITGATSVGLYGADVDADVAQGRYGTAALKSLAILAPDADALLATTDVDRASNDAALLSDYRAQLASGKTPEEALNALGRAAAKQIKALVKDYGNPDAVTKAQTRTGTELKHARTESAKDNTKDNAKEHLLKDPAVKAGGSAVDGPDSDSGSDSGSDSDSGSGDNPGPCAPGQLPLMPPRILGSASGISS
jgi:hypothetical protein